MATPISRRGGFQVARCERVWDGLSAHPARGTGAACASASSGAATATDSTCTGDDGFVCGSATPGPPAFDCGRTRRLAEIAICRDPRLGSCDRILNAAFYEAQARAGRGAVALRRDQEAWLARRDACVGAAARGPAVVADCIGRAYDERIAELEAVRTHPTTAAPVSPSFNCRYARTAVEQAICSDPALAAKDRRMARLYERDGCARVAGPALHACIHGAYDARITELGR
jgi:uncharacterized protein